MKNNIQQTTYNRQITANPYLTVNRKPSTVNRIYHSSFVIHNCPQASPIPHKNKNGKPIIQWTSPKGPARAGIHTLSGYSAHADQSMLVSWVKSMPKPPGKITLVHGEAHARKALARALGLWRIIQPTARSATWFIPLPAQTDWQKSTFMGFT